MLENKIIKLLTSPYSHQGIDHAETAHNLASITLATSYGERNLTAKMKITVKRQDDGARVLVSLDEDGNEKSACEIPVSDTLYRLIGNIASEWANGRRRGTKESYQTACNLVDRFSSF